MNGLARWRSLLVSSGSILAISVITLARTFEHSTSAQPLLTVVGILSATASVVSFIALACVLVFRDRIVNTSR